MKNKQIPSLQFTESTLSNTSSVDAHFQAENSALSLSSPSRFISLSSPTNLNRNL
jgi:hypothetical protein